MPDYTQDEVQTTVGYERSNMHRGTPSKELMAMNSRNQRKNLDDIRIAKDAGYTAVFSHRAGKTEDTAIADPAAATCAGQITSGSLCRSYRIGKDSQLLCIDDVLLGTAPYAAGGLIAGRFRHS